MSASLLIALVTSALTQAPGPSAASAPAPSDAHARMVATLKTLADEAARSNPFFGRAPLETTEAELAALPPGEKPKIRLRLLRDRGFQKLRLGDVDGAVESYESALTLTGERPKAFGPKDVVDTWFDLGVAYLRLGETTNCVAKHCKASCIFPIAAGGRHAEARGSENAARCFEQVLRQQPTHLGARWLLNVARMTLGTYPEAVPDALRIPLAPFEGGADFPRFPDVAQELGLDAPTLAGGIVADDFDGDGVLDLVNTNWGASEQMRVWKGLGGGRFADRTREANLLGITGGLQLTHADYDGDGDLDLFVLRGAWMRQHGRWPNSLLQNDGAGRFVDVTYDVGLAEPMYPRRPRPGAITTTTAISTSSWATSRARSNRRLRSSSATTAASS